MDGIRKMLLLCFKNQNKSKYCIKNNDYKTNLRLKVSSPAITI